MQCWTLLCGISMFWAGGSARPTSEPVELDKVFLAQAEEASNKGFARPVTAMYGTIREMDIMVKYSEPTRVATVNDPATERQGRKRRSYDSSVSRWPNGKIFYKFEEEFTSHRTASFNSIFDSVKEDFEALTCMRLVERTDEWNYISIDARGGCWSYVGMTGGMQQLSLSPGCHTKRVMVHELLHAVGFQHEQTRPDRDDFVEILTDNIADGAASQFAKITEDAWDNHGSPYDYQSVMHYGSHYFSRNQQKTIRTLDPDYQDKIGKYQTMSREDIVQFNKAYDCPVNTRFDLTEASGLIKTPRYPADYPGDTWREWRVTVPSGRAKIVSLDMDLEAMSVCSYDYVEIFDGHTVDSPSLGKFCGNTEIDVQATGRRMMVRFFSDADSHGRGFKLRYTSGVEGPPPPPPPITSTTAPPQPSGCGQTRRTSLAGVITSPGFPGYSNNEHCQWQIIVPTGNVVQLESTEFHLESESTCDYDYLRISDGLESYSTVLLTACGNHSITATSSSNKMMLNFVSDGSQTRRGFKLRYVTRYIRPSTTPTTTTTTTTTTPTTTTTTTTTERSVACGGTMSDISGYLTSPNYPDNYENDLRCSWIIEAGVGITSIHIESLEFDLEEVRGCEYDYLSIHEGADNDAPRIGIYCGSNKIDVTSSAGKIFLSFFTDDSITRRGFKLKYTQTAGCGGDIKASSGDITSPGYPGNYPDETRCEWRVTVPEGRRIKFTSSEFVLEAYSCQYDYVKIFDGFSTANYEHGTWCDDQAVSATTDSNTALLKFVSDIDTNFRGFKIHFEVYNENSGCLREIFVNSEGVISSENYPSNYEGNARCQWKLTAPADSVIQLESEFFEVEYNADCAYDHVEIHDGSSDTHKYCGSKSHIQHTSVGNEMMIRFASDWSIQRKGFSFRYRLGIKYRSLVAQKPVEIFNRPFLSLFASKPPRSMSMPHKPADVSVKPFSRRNQTTVPPSDNSDNRGGRRVTGGRRVPGGRRVAGGRRTKANKKDKSRPVDQDD